MNAIYEVIGEDGMAARVFNHAKGFSVVLRDEDAGMTVAVFIHADLESAKDKAHKVAPTF